MTTPLIFHPNFGDVFVGADRPRWGDSEPKP